MPEVRCGGPLDVHEVWTRARFPGSELQVEAAVLVCRRHHDWIGNHPAPAAALGLLAWSWEATPYERGGKR